MQLFSYVVAVDLCYNMHKMAGILGFDKLSVIVVYKTIVEDSVNTFHSRRNGECFNIVWCLWAMHVWMEFTGVIFTLY